MKYQSIFDFRSTFSVEKMCHIFNVSRSGYYAWLKRCDRPRAKERRGLLTAIRIIHEEPKKKAYGSPRMTRELIDKGYHCSENRIARIMHNNGICSRIKRKYKTTTDSTHQLPVADNVLAQHFVAACPNQVWVSDITYIPTLEGWVYLAAILDVYSRSIVGWAVRNRIDRHLVIQAFQNAAIHRQPKPGLIVHSDRGSQYASDDYRRVLNKYGVRQSMSGTGNCYDNAMMESFFHSLKAEHVSFQNYLTRDHAKKDLFDYIELFYNRERRHSAIKYLSPAAYERRFSQAA